MVTTEPQTTGGLSSTIISVQNSSTISTQNATTRPLTPGDYLDNSNVTSSEPADFSSSTSVTSSTPSAAVDGTNVTDVTTASTTVTSAPEVSSQGATNVVHNHTQTGEYAIFKKGKAIFEFYLNAIKMSGLSIFKKRKTNDKHQICLATGIDAHV